MADSKNNNQKEKESEQVVTLEFDDGKEVECMIEGVFDSDGQDYIALIPEDKSGDVYIYRYIENEDGDYRFEDEDDEARFDKAVREYESMKGYKRREDKDDTK